MNRTAIVCIGRNEAPRLARCLDSVLGLGARVVYVDSGSTDGSPRLARSRGVDVVELDRSIAFTAGRARNEGLRRALSVDPRLELVQFVDGDCELVPGWIERGVRELRGEATLAMVCGRVRERDRERNVYTRLCDMEWDRPVGETGACGGNFLARVAAFERAGGFDPQLIAGEEADLCLRIRRNGLRIVRLGDDMVVHDSGMTRFRQWWHRTVRTGWSFTETAVLHAASPERLHLRSALSVLAWGALLPLLALLAAPATSGWSLVALAVYPVLWSRVYLPARRRGRSPRDARLLASFTVLGKFPQALGQIHFVLMRALGRRRPVVDWRHRDASASRPVR